MASTRFLKIVPRDLLFFRDLKPFGAGDNHFADSIFPPHLSTIYNALRTYLLLKHDVNLYGYKNGNGFCCKTLSEKKVRRLKEEVGTPGEDGTLAIRSVVLMRNRNNEIDALLPCPADLIAEREDDEIKQTYLQLLSRNDLECISSSNPLPGYLLFLKESVEREEFWVIAGGFKNYLLEETVDKDAFVPKGEVIHSVLHTGIAVDSAKNTVHSGMLYTLRAVQMADNYGIGVELDSNFFDEKDLFQLGGETKVVHFTPSDDWLRDLRDESLKEEIKSKVCQSKVFKLVFLTDSFLDEGWRSESFEKKLKQQYGAELIAALVPRPRKLSGWDIVKGRPKPLHNLVLAGSVYYFRLMNDSKLDQLFEDYYLGQLTDGLHNHGYGLTIIGGRKNVQV